MKKTSIHLPEAWIKQLRKLAIDADSSMAELIRVALKRKYPQLKGDDDD